MLNRSRHVRSSAELEAYDGFSDSQEEEMTEEQQGALFCRIYGLISPLILLQRK